MIVSVPIKVYRLNGRQMILAADMVFVAKRDMARRVYSSTPERGRRNKHLVPQAYPMPWRPGRDGLGGTSCISQAYRR